jgi:DNA-binding CsgD family transcriptional regulator
VADDLAARATAWLQDVWATRATDALAAAGALPAAGDGLEQGRADASTSLRRSLATVTAGDALAEACDALADVLAMANLRDEPRGDVSAVLDAARHPMLLVDAQRRFVDANGPATALLGVAREELRLRRLDDFVTDRWRSAFAARWSELEPGTRSGALLLGLPSGAELTAGYTAAIGIAPDRHLVLVERVDGVRFGPWVRSASAGDEEPKLRPREREILALVAAGRTSAGIARQLALSRNTVESHIRNAVVRLGACNRTHAVVRALGRGEIALPRTRERG